MKIDIDVEPWCHQRCRYFELDEEKYYSYDDLAMVNRSCKNLGICRNAVKLHEFWKEGHHSTCTE